MDANLNFQLTVVRARWMLVRGESIVGMFAASLAAYLVYGQRESDASKTGFSLTMASAYSLAFA